MCPLTSLDWACEGLVAVLCSCNDNGAGRHRGLERGVSEDCNANGIPDEFAGVPFVFGVGQDSLTVAPYRALSRPAVSMGTGMWKSCRPVRSMF